MTIVELNHQSNFKNATISLTYDEIRDITNLLYEAQKNKDEYKILSAKWSILFDIVKNGMVTPFTIMTSSRKGYTEEERFKDV